MNQHRNGLISKIHIARKDLGLDEIAYRACLATATGGKESCIDMHEGELQRVVEYFQNKGWQPKPPTKARAKQLASAPQHKKIRALWLALADAGVVRDRGEPALRSYVRRQTGVSALQWLTPEQAGSVIESLKNWCQRERVEVQK